MRRVGVKMAELRRGERVRETLRVECRPVVELAACTLFKVQGSA